MTGRSAGSGGNSGKGRTLSEHAVQSFDVPFPHPEQYLNFLREHLETPPRRILDLGGGNGTFLDSLLDCFDEAHGVLLERSSSMAALNRPHDRKSVLLADAMAVPMCPDAGSFDLITINVFLHHIVGITARETDALLCGFLRELPTLMTSRGVIAVYEYVYEGWLVEPGRLIFGLTSIKQPFISWLLNRSGANTAGVGVYFRSPSAWREVFDGCDLRVARDASLGSDRIRIPRRIFLNVNRVGPHIFLLRAN